MDDIFGSEDRAIVSESDSHGVAGSGVDVDRHRALLAMEVGVEDALFDFIDIDASDHYAKSLTVHGEKVVSERSDRSNILETSGDSLCLVLSDEDGHATFAVAFGEEESVCAGFLAL